MTHRFQTYGVVFSSNDDGASRVEELEPVLGEGGLLELLANVVEVNVLQDDVFQVETNGSHLRSSLKIFDDIFRYATYDFLLFDKIF